MSFSVPGLNIFFYAIAATYTGGLQKFCFVSSWWLFFQRLYCYWCYWHPRQTGRTNVNHALGVKVNTELQDMYRITLPGGVYCYRMLVVLAKIRNVNSWARLKGYSTELSLLRVYSLIYTFIYVRHKLGMRGPIFSANILPSEVVRTRGVRAALV